MCLIFVVHNLSIHFLFKNKCVECVDMSNIQYSLRICILHIHSFNRASKACSGMSCKQCEALGWEEVRIWEALGWAGVYGSWWEPDRSAPPDRSGGRANWREGHSNRAGSDGKRQPGQGFRGGNFPTAGAKCPSYNLPSVWSALSPNPPVSQLVDVRGRPQRHMLLCQRAAAGSRFKALEAAGSSFPSNWRKRKANPGSWPLLHS